ncbi:RsmB/NOP family class I SAM-dependent RNA methyltransferase [Paenibacillus soyae]|uniref:RsmB/NOP family class I SAM-dependent RNA methyltransferase n=1 Tax=Paenibacillus soyae TaxID=2969249 RepID=A0A9X2MM58_9BACL|nr:RsmB/NOP family class I SAM-dependent RNA methyltransferase [Paenibacillus soyae]MCR2803229.1 RsmB/NOP family class I SAM-dependent RNA methyltransferase [Paenibacillus soyae]
MNQLPVKFLEKMEAMLQSEYDAFMKSYEAPRVYGLRVNPLKINVEDWLRLSPMRDRVKPIPWAKEGLYYSEEDRPGKHPHHNAGLYYIQEPSAMLPVELLDVRPGHRVLDLCAAPGGKSTQIAGKLQGKGILVSNDIASERTKALAKNIELLGVRNAVILNEDPSSIARSFPGWFDRILVDAPCSGEGMFRKDESMAASWESYSITRCVNMQRDILAQVATMLKPGGLMVYSTCTFSPEENETQMADFLAKHPDFYIEAAPKTGGVSSGRPDLVDEETAARVGPEVMESLAGTARLWPHLLEGEGHFVAVLRRSGEARAETLAANARPAAEPARMAKGKQGKGRAPEKQPRGGKQAAAAAADPREIWLGFKEKELLFVLDDDFVPVTFGNAVYLQHRDLPPLDGLKVVRAGWLAGEAKNGRFHPAQSLAMGLTRDEAVRSISWSAEAEETGRYLRGETLFVPEEDLRCADGAGSKGYVLVCVDGYPAGWSKYSDGMLKNELTPGWRRL